MPFIQPKVDRVKHTIDATGKTPGRLATQISILLQGKHKVTYQPNWDLGDSVEIVNVSKMGIHPRKLEQKVHYTVSGYLGGLKEIPWKRMMQERPERVLYLAVYRMLPKNKLRDRMIKRMSITA